MSQESLAVIEHGTLAEWSPEELRLRMQNEKELRQIVVGYYSGEMKQGHHFYNIGTGQDAKPALSKEGALNLCSLFKVTPHPEQPSVTYHDDGHFTVIFRCLLKDRFGNTVSVGDGLCSTKESKYAFRWAFENEVPAALNKESLETRTVGRNSSYKQYKIQNQNLADLYNTILKMADKRAAVAAALKLPLVSELFTQDLEEQITAKPKAEKQQPRAEGPAEPKQAAMSDEDKERQAQLSIETETLLGNLFGEDADATKRFLKGRQPAMMPLDKLESLNADIQAMIDEQ